MCPLGYYCPEGSSAPQACPTNTYNDKLGASDLSYCLACPANKICSGTAVSDPKSECPAGYYCITFNGVL